MSVCPASSQLPRDAKAPEQLAIADLSVELTVKRGPPRPLLRGVSLTLERGRVLGLIGESGSGKTMICRAVVGALPPHVQITDGEIRVGEVTMRRAGERKSGGRSVRVGMVFADPHASLDPLQRIGPQIAEVVQVHTAASRRAASVEALRLLEQVRIPEPGRVYPRFPFELSGGMAQRAMIASVLAAKPHFVLADEPTSALDATVQLEILGLLTRLVREEHVGVLLTTHDMAVAARTCDRIGVMYAGRVVEVGPSRSVLENPEHPYTRLLLHARPRGTRTERLMAIPGEPPMPGAAQDPCPFAPRCPHAVDVCRQEEPAMIELDGNSARCHFAGRLPEVTT